MQARRGIQSLVEVLGIRWYVDAEFFDQALGNRTVGSRALNGKCSAKAQAERTTDAKFVALGVSSKVVVVFEDEDACFSATCLAVKMRGGKAADSAADDNQIVDFAGLFRLARRIPESAVAQSVGGVKRTGMAAPHSC